jgi:hypothetical protein
MFYITYINQYFFQPAQVSEIFDNHIEASIRLLGLKKSPTIFNIRFGYFEVSKR